MRDYMFHSSDHCPLGLHTPFLLASPRGGAAAEQREAAEGVSPCLRLSVKHPFRRTAVRHFPLKEDSKVFLLAPPPRGSYREAAEGVSLCSRLTAKHPFRRIRATFPSRGQQGGRFASPSLPARRLFAFPLSLGNSKNIRFVLIENVINKVRLVGTLFMTLGGLRPPLPTHPPCNSSFLLLLLSLSVFWFGSFILG